MLRLSSPACCHRSSAAIANSVSAAWAQELSRSVNPPFSCVVSLKVTRFQRISMSGWWFRCSASRATRFTQRMADWKSEKTSVRTQQPPSKVHLGTWGVFSLPISSIALRPYEPIPPVQASRSGSSSQNLGNNGLKGCQQGPNKRHLRLGLGLFPKRFTQGNSLFSPV